MIFLLTCAAGIVFIFHLVFHISVAVCICASLSNTCIYNGLLGINAFKRVINV